MSRRPNGVLNYHNAGKVQASSEPQDMRLQRMLGHLTTLCRSNREGARHRLRRRRDGGCGVDRPGVKHETIAEIEPLVPNVVSTYFAEHNFDVVRNPKVNVHIDDARHFLETTNEKFDADYVGSARPVGEGRRDALHARVLRDGEGASESRRRRDAVRAALREQHRSGEERDCDVPRSVPERDGLRNTNNGQGYDLVLLGQVEPTKIDVDAIQARLERPSLRPWAVVARNRHELRRGSVGDLCGTQAGSWAWLKDAQINRDSNLRLQYLAGLGLNLYQADVIYADMLRYVSTMPDDLFVASDSTRQRLYSGILRQQGR